MAARANVVIRVQHAAGRDEALERLLKTLPPAAEVVTDEEVDDPNPWRNYQRCLSDLPAKTTHVCVLQDDTIACHNFLPALKRIASDELICLFLGSYPPRTSHEATKALARGLNMIEIHPYDLVPAVANLWPIELAEDLLTWTSENPRRLPGNPPRSDDAVITRWKRHRRRLVRAVATVPSLVEHPDDTPSTIGLDRRSPRMAKHFIGEDDPLKIW